MGMHHTRSAMRTPEHRPEVSVLLPFRDAAPTLADALGSILAERDVDLELVAVDDGSSDGSRAVADGLSANDRRLRVVAGPGRGITRALEVGLAHVRAPFVARMDADDLSLPGRLPAQLARMRDEPRLAALGTRVEAFGAGEVGAGLVRYVAWQNALITPDDHAREIFVEAPLCHPSVMLRRDALERVGGYREGPFPEDYDLWLRLAHAREPMAKLERLGLRWRHGPGRLTFTDSRYSVENIRALKARHLVARLALETRELVMWGAGPFGRRLARALAAEGRAVARFVDIDPRKIGRKARGVPITTHAELDPTRELVIFAVGSLGARELVRDALVAARFVEGRDFLCAA